MGRPLVLYCGAIPRLPTTARVGLAPTVDQRLHDVHKTDPMVPLQFHRRWLQQQ